MSNRHHDKRGTLGHQCRPTGSDMSGVPCNYPLVCKASGGDTGGVKLCMPPSTPTHLMQCGGVPNRGACPVGFKCDLSSVPGAAGRCAPDHIPAHIMTCGPSGQQCPRNFKCIPSKNGAIGAPGHCVPLRLGPDGKYKGHSYQCVDGLGCHLTREPASTAAGRFSDYATCEKACPVPTTLRTYYQCGGKQGVNCTGPHPGFPNPKKGRFASSAACRAGTVCGKPVPMHIAWPDWDDGVGASDPFLKITADTGNINDPIQNFMGEPAPGLQRTHLWRPGRPSKR